MSRWVFKVFTRGDRGAHERASRTRGDAQQPAPSNARRDVGTLKITVVDETGAAIVDTPVRIWSEKGVDRTVQTSQRGEAVFENLTPGKYAVHVESIGFDAQDFEQNVRRGNTNKQVTLAIASFVEQVDVTRDETEKALNDSFSTQLTQEQIESAAGRRRRNGAGARADGRPRRDDPRQRLLGRPPAAEVADRGNPLPLRSVLRRIPRRRQPARRHPHAGPATASGATR